MTQRRGWAEQVKKKLFYSSFCCETHLAVSWMDFMLRRKKIFSCRFYILIEWAFMSVPAAVAVPKISWRLNPLNRIKRSIQNQNLKFLRRAKKNLKLSIDWLLFQTLTGMCAQNVKQQTCNRFIDCSLDKSEGEETTSTANCCFCTHTDWLQHRLRFFSISALNVESKSFN